VAVYAGAALLLVRCSYRVGWHLPGGGIRRTPAFQVAEVGKIYRSGTPMRSRPVSSVAARIVGGEPALRCLLLVAATVAGFVSTCRAQPATAPAAAPPGVFEVSFTPGSRDDAGRFMGGTEMRVLAAHAGRLYSGNGYWEDRPGPEGPQGAEILVLDRPAGRWRVDHAFDEPLPDGRRRDLAASALEEVRFATDGNAARLPAPVSMLIAANWDLGGTSRVFSRDDATGGWTGATLAVDSPRPGFLPQVRSFGQHRDRVTGTDRIFAGQDPRGIFSGTYDPTVAGLIRWGALPELNLSRVSSAGISGSSGYPRVSSFAVCNGRLYAAVGQQIYERVDGETPEWRLVYSNRYPGHSETGLRGLTAVPAATGGGEALLAAVEGSAARIVRVDPRDGSEGTELDLRISCASTGECRPVT
jgi:hypothetical protein